MPRPAVKAAGPAARRAPPAAPAPDRRPPPPRCSLLALLALLACATPPADAPSPPPEAAPTAPATPAAAPVPAAPAAGARASEGIRVQAAYARAMPPTATNSAAFLTLQSAAGTALVGARTEVATAELHTHAEEGGVMRMRQVERIELPAGQSVELKPGGFHVMLVGLKKPMVAGEEFELTLVFADGSEHSLFVPVREIAEAPAHGG